MDLQVEVHTTSVHTHSVRGAEPVVMVVEVGNAQLATVSARLGSRQLDISGPHPGFSLGEGTGLIGQTLHLTIAGLRLNTGLPFKASVSFTGIIAGVASTFEASPTSGKAVAHTFQVLFR